MPKNAGNYFRPSPLLHEMWLLESILSGEVPSQQAMAEAVGVTPAMVNAYLKRLEADGYVNISGRPGRMTYELTEQGKQRLSYHRISYLAELMDLQGTAIGEFKSFFRRLSDQGCREILLYGAGETASVAMAALGGMDRPCVKAILDDSQQKQGSTLAGVPVVQPAQILAYPDLVVVVTSWKFDREIRELLRSLSPSAVVYSLSDIYG